MNRKETAFFFTPSRIWSAAAFFYIACAGGKPAERTEQPPQTAPAESRQPTVHRIEAGVDEKNLLFKDRAAATEYLRSKLVGLAAERIAALGFDQPRAQQMALSGRLTDFEINSQRKKFAGKGAEEGKIVEGEVWQVRGKLEVALGDGDVEYLCQIFAELPVDSLEAAEKLEGLLAGLESLSPPDDRLEQIKERLAVGWAQALGALLQAVREAKMAPPRIPPELEQVTERMRKFMVRFASRQQAVELSRLLGQVWLRWLSAGGPEMKIGEARQFLKLVREKTQGIGDATQYVERAVELAWRDRLEQLDSGGKPFSATREEFLIFLEEFPASRFYSELELRFAVRWVEHLMSVAVPDLKALEELEREVALLGSRFPSLSQRAEVVARLGSECLRLLAVQQPPDLDGMAEVRRVLRLCDPYLPAGMESSRLRLKLDEIEQQLVRQRDDALERQALKGLDFFIAWEKAIRQLKWGVPAGAWQGQGDFQRLWSQGRDAGSDCQCSLDPEEPCRLFEENGPRGGFEVVARFHQGKLAGIDLCNVYVGNGLAAVYGFFSRRYPRQHQAAAATRLVSTGEGEVAFGKGEDLRWWLSCGGGTCLVRARDGKLHQAMLEQQKEEKRELQASLQQQRQRRIEKGWGAGDCVRWECAGECVFQGRVERKEGKRYQVTIERSLEDPRLAGTRRWVAEEELYDCL